MEQLSSHRIVNRSALRNAIFWTAFGIALPPSARRLARTLSRTYSAVLDLGYSCGFQNERQRGTDTPGPADFSSFLDSDLPEQSLCDALGTCVFRVGTACGCYPPPGRE